MPQLILASTSPRRRELLEKAGFEFTVDTVKVSEIIDENLTVRDVVLDLATLKAVSLLEQKYSGRSGFLILAADTLVSLGEEPLGKPRDVDEAVAFLTRLSGRTHCVRTGVVLIQSDRLHSASFVGETNVSFRELSKAEIEAYVASGEPMDKAGAYGIQGEARKFVSKVEGSWSNVVGLPIEMLEEVLNQNGWFIDRTKSGAR